MSEYSFPKSYRLLSKGDFARLKSDTQRFQTGSIRCFYKENSLDHARLGISVSKKVGHAVCRNFFKRQIREFFRTSKLREVSVDMNVVVFPNLTKNFDSAEKQKEELLNSLQKFQKKLTSQ